MKHKIISTWQVKGLVFKHDSDYPNVVVCHNEGPHQDRTFTFSDLEEMREVIGEVATKLLKGGK